MKNLKLPSLIGAVLLMFSCANNSNGITSSDENNYATCMDSFDPSPNSFIWMAQYHNDHLQEIIEVVKLDPTIQRFQTEIYKIAPEIEIFPFQFADIIQGNETFEDYINRQGSFSPIVKNYSLHMIDIINRDDDVIQNLQATELTILNDTNLSNIERDALLQSYAICQGSYCYWSNNYSEWSFNRDVPDWMKNIISADAVVALGMAIGIGAGWLIPPVTVGAVIWTGGSSVGASAATGLVMGAGWVLNEFTSWW